MSSPLPDPGVTMMLRAAADGNPDAAARLLPLLYDELRRLAQHRIRAVPPGNTLQPTALVHEAYMRLVGAADPGWNGRAHFFGAAATAMRDILVEQARRKGAEIRGGDRARVEMPDAVAPQLSSAHDIVALDKALRRLEAKDPDKARLVMLRYFAGLTGAQAAAALGVSERTVEREWRYAKAWLHRDIESQQGARDE